GNSQIPLEQMLAERRGMGGAAAGAGHDQRWRMTFAAGDQFLHRLVRGLLPSHGVRGLSELRRHSGPVHVPLVNLATSFYLGPSRLEAQRTRTISGRSGCHYRNM